MARIPLGQYDQDMRAVLLQLSEMLPTGFTVGGVGRDLWIDYPDDMREAAARDEIGAALSAITEPGLRAAPRRRTAVSPPALLRGFLTGLGLVLGIAIVLAVVAGAVIALAQLPWWAMLGVIVCGCAALWLGGTWFGTGFHCDPPRPPVKYIGWGLPPSPSVDSLAEPEVPYRLQITAVVSGIVTGVAGLILGVLALVL